MRGIESSIYAVYSNARKTVEKNMSLDFKTWSARLFESVSNLSRTSKGESKKTHEEKPILLITDPVELQKQSAQNLRAAIEYVWNRGPYVRTETEQVRVFITDLSKRISRLLVADDAKLRTWDIGTKYPNRVAPEDVPAAYNRFCEEVAMRLQAVRADAAQEAAWIERAFDSEVHPLPDGCGRVARLLGAWMLLRAEKYPARFENRTAYYDAMESSDEAWEHFYRTHLHV